MKILLVDDMQSNRLVLRCLLEDKGHECIEAVDGQDGLESFMEHKPDLVLLDVVMPNMDGYEAARLMKQNSKGTHVPIIFLTAKNDDQSLIECLESGGDDFLTKPINEIILYAKIQAHERTTLLTQELGNKNQELTDVYNLLKEENQMGEHVLSHAFKRSLTGIDNVQQFVSPMSAFNGDLCLVAERPSGGLYILLGDFTGHGLSASIGSVPVSQLFFSLCQKNIPLSELASRLNRELTQFLPDHMFCAMVLVEMNQHGDQAFIWNGGLPAGFISRPGEGVVQRLESRHMPMGILEAEEFDSEVEVFKLHTQDSLVFFTDGIIEGRNCDGKMFGEKAILDAVGDADVQVMGNIVREYQKFTEGSAQQDDISIVEIQAIPYKASSDRQPVSEDDELMPWKVSVGLQLSHLKRNNDPVVSIMGMLPGNRIYRKHYDRLRLLLTELFSNALEHGLLGLSSSLKETPEGFVAYYEAREQGLQNLQQGQIGFCLEYLAESGNALIITVEDSGEGFEYEKLELEEIDDCSGRGLPLIVSLANRISFSNGGRCTRVEYLLD